MGDTSSTTPATLFTGCFTAEEGSTNPILNFLSFDNHSSVNLSISAPDASHYPMYNMYRGHCIKRTSVVNINV